MTSKIVSAERAAELVRDRSTIYFGGLISILCPEKVLSAIGARYKSTGHPSELTLFAPIRVGWRSDSRSGLEHFAYAGMLKRIFAGSFHPTEGPELIALVRDNKVEAYCWPMGMMFDWVRAVARGDRGFLCEAGLGTFVDPRMGGGKLNAKTTKDLVHLVNFQGRESMWVETFPVDVSIIMGTTADLDGNITMEEEPVILASLYAAMAAKNSGGIVIAQVKRMAQAGTLNPRSVVVPGALVDAVVVDPYQRQTRLDFDPSICGLIRVPMEQYQRSLPLTQEKVILRRAAMELKAGDLVNLGIGIGVDLPQVLFEEGIFDLIKLSVEHGAIGGLPGDARIFGAHYNPEAIIDSVSLFDFYRGGGLDATVLGFAQVDSAGNVNVSKFGGRLRGPGGLIDITHKTKKVMFCGTLEAGDPCVEICNGHVKVIREGKIKKFVNQIEQVTFNGRLAFQKGQKVMFITERCVFELTEDGLMLTEIAPGADLHKDVISRLEFEVEISPSLRVMDSRIFQVEPMGLSRDWATFNATN